MALRLRRGTDAQRQLITPAEGELIYVTDTKDLYVGDGTTLGGVLVTAGISALDDLNDVDTSGALIGQVLKYDGVNWVPGDDLSGGGGGGGGSISVGADDSTLRVINAGESFLILGGTNISTTSDAEGNITVNNDFVQNFSFSALTGTPTTLSGYGITDALPLSGGTMSGNVNFGNNNLNNVFVITSDRLDTNEILANFIRTNAIVGDLTGNVYNQDSTLAFDSSTGEIIGNLTGNVYTQDSTLAFDSSTGNIFTKNITSNQSLDFNFVGNVNFVKNGLPSLYFNNNQPSVDLSVGNTLHGVLIFQTTDINGTNNSLVIGAAANGCSFNKTDANYALPNSHKLFIGTNGNFGFGTINPTEKFDFAGNGKFSGTVSAAALKGSLVLDDSTIVIDGITGDVFANTLTSGALYFSNSNISTTDSSSISVTQTTIFNSDVNVENDLFVTNNIIAKTLEVENIITNASGTPEIESDTDIILSAGTRVEISSSPFKLASFTTGERDALSAQNGDMIYNTTANKFQGYAGGTWVDLH